MNAWFKMCLHLYTITTEMAFFLTKNVIFLTEKLKILTEIAKSLTERLFTSKDTCQAQRAELIGAARFAITAITV